MNKNMCFTEYERKENTKLQPLDRITSFNEFRNELNQSERQIQAARCMNCGVPMCQSALRSGGMVTGCPLHNLIPEWNDALYNGYFETAVLRLLKTSSFPEFTGRVCPALCEKACQCGNIQNNIQPVTVHDNELFIIEKAFAEGYMNGNPPKVRSGKKVAVVGSGPAGLAVADMLNKRGHLVTVYERDDCAGGLLMYGIPNMKLDKKIIERRISLMEKEGVTFIYNADIGSPDSAVTVQSIRDSYDAVALCCGAKKPRGLDVPGCHADGVYYAVDFLTAVTKSLVKSKLTDGLFPDPKGKNVIIIGGGDTGNDCTGTCVRLGASSVTQIEMMARPPVERASDNPWPQWPKILKTDYGVEEAITYYGKDPRIYETVVKEIYTTNNCVSGVKTIKVKFETINGKRTLVEIAGTEKNLDADIILIAAGFLGCEDYCAKSFGAGMSERHTVAADNHYKTNIAGVFTAGDMHRGQSLVVWAILEGRECAQEIDAFLTGRSAL